MDEKQNKNFIIAIVLSMLVVLTWQVFYALPKMEEDKLRRDRLEQQAAEQPGAASGTTAGTVAPSLPTAVSVYKPREEVLKTNPRVAIDTPALQGSISLKGARFDDIVFKRLNETSAKGSPKVKLFTPVGAEHAHYADFGWAGADGKPLIGPETLWQATAGAILTPTTPVTLTHDTGAGLSFRRMISIDKDYMLTVKDEVQNTATMPVTLQPTAAIVRYGGSSALATWVLHEGFVGVAGDGGIQAWLLDTVKSDGNQVFTGKGGWGGITDKYWAAVHVPSQDRDYTLNFRHTAEPTSIFSVDTVQGPLTVQPGATGTLESRLFAGAKEVHKVDAYATNQAIPKFNYLIDWGWFWFITQPLFYLIDYIYKLVGNFGVAILLVTVIVKAAFFPLANKSYESMSKMKKLQPEMQKIQERFKDDRARQQQAIMELYKKEKVNPMAGCLPILVQIPVFFALYKVLFGTIEMRHAPFFGWIQDLSAPDPTSIFNLFGLLPFEVPQMLLIGVWPIVMGITMWAQMKLNPPPPDPIQAKMFAYMPLIFTFMLGTFPAGLVIYWAWNNLISILQQSVIMKRQGVKVELFDNMKASFAGMAKTLSSLRAGSTSDKAADAKKK